MIRTRKLLSLILSIIILLGILPINTFTVNAKTEYTKGYYTYTISNGEATITDCDTSISGEVIIPCDLDGYPVTSIGRTAFWGCTLLTSIVIPNNVTSIGGCAFYGCSSLTSITIPDDVISIEDSVFKGCSSLTSITIPNGVTSIDSFAFYGCSSLTSITIPDGVTSIGDSAFQDCSSLTSITIPDGATRIISYTFCDCSSLTSITIPKGVTSIDDSAFYGCGSLTSITIPKGVIAIGDFTFYDCKALETVYYGGTEEEWNNISIADCNEPLTSATIHFLNEHEHTFSDWQTRINATCTTEGEEYRTCSSCGEEEIRTVSATGHTYGSAITQPTCTEQGYTTYTCSDCEDSYVDNYTEALGHRKNTISIKNPAYPTNPYPYNFAFELNNGIYSSTNKVGNSFSEVIITALENCSLEIHYFTSTESGYDIFKITQNSTNIITASGISESWSSITLNLTKDDKIYINYKKDDSFSKGEDTVYFKLNSHTIPTESIEPSCEKGVICDICEVNVKSAKGHFYDNTCDTTCNVCGNIRTINHIYNSVITSPTCTEQGYTTYTCENCGDSYIDNYTEALGHSFGDWITKANATCTTNGEEYHICSICDEEETRTISATGHTYNFAITQPTCTKQGYTTYTCENCEDRYVDNYTEELGHDFDTEFTIDKAVTETENGSKSRHCKRCDEVTDVTIIPRKITQYRYKEKSYTSSEEELTKPWILYDSIKNIQHHGTQVIYLHYTEDINSYYCVHDTEYGINKYVYEDYSFYATQSEYAEMCAFESAHPSTSHDRILYAWFEPIYGYRKYTCCRYTTCSATYYYYKWSNWSTWSETSYTASDDVEVEKIQTYDETLDSENLVTLRQSLLSDKISDESSMLLDYNADETLDIRDLIRLKKYLASI